MVKKKLFQICFYDAKAVVKANTAELHVLKNVLTTCTRIENGAKIQEDTKGFKIKMRFSSDLFNVYFEATLRANLNEGRRDKKQLCTNENCINFLNKSIGKTRK